MSRRKRSEAPCTAVGARHVRVTTDGRFILFARRSRRDDWLLSQTGRIVKANLNLGVETQVGL
jgi:hypothetical protein